MSGLIVAAAAAAAAIIGWLAICTRRAVAVAVAVEAAAVQVALHACLLARPRLFSWFLELLSGRRAAVVGCHSVARYTPTQTETHGSMPLGSVQPI